MKPIKYITDFHKSRQAKIGASDIPHLIPHPEMQIESLAAYSKKGKRFSCTALDLYNDKINGKPFEYSFPAEMGHNLEGFALYEFIKDNISVDIAKEFLHGYQSHEIEQKKGTDNAGRYTCVNPIPYNTTPFKHNTEAVSEYGVAHADCVYVPPDERFYNVETGDGGIVLGKKDIITNKMQHIINKNGLKIDLSKPFIIEAKSARLYSVTARKKDKYKGFDLTLKSWQGIPLKFYFQIQYQLAEYEIDIAYLALIFDTSEKHYWQIKANKKHQRELIQIAQYMKTCIDTKTPPTEFLMNSKDIANLYPVIKDDFREVKETELQEMLEIATTFRNADTQEKAWKKKKIDAEERMSLHLKDTDTIKGVVNGVLQTITKWKYTGGGERLMGLKDIGERDDSKKLLNYFKKNKLIKTGEKNKKPSVVIKLSELEGE